MSGRGEARVTVLMPMRNAGRYLAEAMNSILMQFERDFFFLVIDDGSTDDSVAIAESLADARTEIVHDGRQLGVAARLNWGLDRAKTRYVARMDADDIAAPHRLKLQLAFMQEHPEIGICGSWHKVLGRGGKLSSVQLPSTHDRMRAMTLFATPFVHPSVVFDMPHLDAAGLRYPEDVPHAEDYDLWERAANRLLFANVEEFLLYYRVHPDQVSTRHNAPQRQAADTVRRRALSRLGADPTEEEFALHSDYSTGYRMKANDRRRAVRAWLQKLEQIARRRGDNDIADDCGRRERALKRLIRREPDAEPDRGTRGLSRLLERWR